MQVSIVGFEIFIERNDAIYLFQALFEKRVIVGNFAKALSIKAVCDVKLRFRITLFGVGFFKIITRDDKIVRAKCF